MAVDAARPPVSTACATGPLLGLRQFDPDDQRFDPDAATQAAARYLRDLYRGEAQASGLLVLASYNWGPTRVKKRIRAMKENPRDRNFWALLAQKDIPKETRDYVFLIFAAAVIGEDPKLFGFAFDEPLRKRRRSVGAPRPLTSQPVAGIRDACCVAIYAWTESSHGSRAPECC